MIKLFVNFNLDEVSLTDKDFSHRRALAKQYIAEFDVNRLMHNFKTNAGIPSDSYPLGGWEDEQCGLRGHFSGHFLSACSKFAFADNDELLKSKTMEIVDILESCAQPNGYLSAFKEEELHTLEQEEDRNVWAPYYTLHKILQGLVDCYLYLNNTKALKLAIDLAMYIYRRFERLSHWKIDGILRCTKVNPANEFGGMGDTLYTLYEITQDVTILELARLFDRDYWLDPLAAGKDVLEDLHANTHLPMVLAAIHRYNLSGELKYKTAVLYFKQFLKGRTFANGNSSSKAAAFITGGVSEKSEHWGRSGRLEDGLTGGESESCCAHNTERMLERSFLWSESPEELDQIEILKYNAVLNSASAKTGLSQYHQPMGSGAKKKFSTHFDSFWCCTASGIEAMSELQKNIWFTDGEALLLNAFISSKLIWKEKKVVITQHSTFPDGLTSELIFDLTEPVKMKVLLKGKSVNSVNVNSAPVDMTLENGYIIIDRLFHHRDSIKIEINAPLRLVPLQGTDHMAAVMFGSVLLAQINPDAAALQDLTSSNLHEKLTQMDKEDLAFVTRDSSDMPAKFIPLFRVEDEEYTVYLDLTGGTLPCQQFSYAPDGSYAYEQS